MKSAVALLTALLWPQTFAGAQATYSVADCSDFEALPSITTDAVIDFTSSPISCDTNTNMILSGNTTLELTSSLEELKLINIRFGLQSGSSLVVSAPNLQWQSEETRERRVGAALSVNEGCAAIFKEDVTFTGCSIFVYSWGDGGGAISNYGDLNFLKNAVFIGTTNGGALFNAGNVTFSGDATFEDNKNVHASNYGGGGLFNQWDGIVAFKGAASFIGNEAKETYYGTNPEDFSYRGGEGGGLLVDGWRDDIAVVFEGPVIFRGNTAKEGAGLHASDGKVVFEDLVTFEDNTATSIGDVSGGGAMAVNEGIVEFQAGVVATGNIAKDGGAFKLLLSWSVVKIEGPVTLTGNEARYEGGAIWNRGNLTIPQDAYIYGNTAVMCPGIKNIEGWEASRPQYARAYSYPDGVVEFTGGRSTFSGRSIEMCYFGEDVGTNPDFALSIDAEAADCNGLFAAGTTLGGYSVSTWDTRVVSEINFDVGSGDFFDVSCANQSMIFVTGGGDVTVTSTTDSMAFTNIRFEVGGYSNLYFNVSELTMTGINNSRIGGSTHVDKGSSLEFWWDVKFLGNTLAYLAEKSWNEYGGAAMFNAGHVIFRGQAYFSLNGQFERVGFWASNPPGGAILNVGSMEFFGTTKFWDNFNLRGGSGGGLANSGQVWFHRRTVWRRNMVAYRIGARTSQIYGGHGGALYNFGPVATTEFFSKGLFRDNVAGLRGGAVAANGDGGDSSLTADNINKITFGHEATFKDNSFDVDRPDTGGGGLWVSANATVEFQDNVVFRRNTAINGGAIMNGGGVVIFASADVIKMTDNVGVESCPDIKNYDKERYYVGELFGDIDDIFETCGSSGDLCTYFEGEVTMGSGNPIVGETPGICEF